MVDHSHTMEDEYTYVCECGELAGCLECGEEWHDCWACDRVPVGVGGRLGVSSGEVAIRRDHVQGTSEGTPGVGRQVAGFKRAYLNEADMQSIGLDPTNFKPAFEMRSGKWYSKDDVLRGINV